MFRIFRVDHTTLHVCGMLNSTTWCEITLSSAQRSTVARTRVREKSREFWSSRLNILTVQRYSVTQIDHKDNIMQTNKIQEIAWHETEVKKVIYQKRKSFIQCFLRQFASIYF